MGVLKFVLLVCVCVCVVDRVCERVGYKLCADMCGYIWCVKASKLFSCCELGPPVFTPNFCAPSLSLVRLNSHRRSTCGWCSHMKSRSRPSLNPHEVQARSSLDPHGGQASSSVCGTASLPRGPCQVEASSTCKRDSVVCRWHRGKSGQYKGRDVCPARACREAAGCLARCLAGERKKRPREDGSRVNRRRMAAGKQTYYRSKLPIKEEGTVPPMPSDAIVKEEELCVVPPMPPHEVVKQEFTEGGALRNSGNKKR